MVRHMKWWGWGEEHITFDHHDKPDLAPFVRANIGLDLDQPAAPLLAFDDLRVPEPHLPDALRTSLEKVVGTEHVTTGRVSSRGGSRLPAMLVPPPKGMSTASAASTACSTPSTSRSSAGKTTTSGGRPRSPRRTRTRSRRLFP